jgi:hypothetical protein
MWRRLYLDDFGTKVSHHSRQDGNRDVMAEVEYAHSCEWSGLLRIFHRALV